jgi:hypothetical protein
MRAVPVDLDWKHLPKEVGKEGALDWLQTIEPAPSIIMESGGGYWAFWLVSDGADMGGPAAIQRKDDKGNLSHPILLSIGR